MKRTGKKILTLLLALCMTLSLAVPGFAASDEDMDDESNVVEDTVAVVKEDISESEVEEDTTADATEEVMTIDESAIQIYSQGELEQYLDDTTNYTQNDTLDLQLASDITLEGTISSIRNPAAITIKGTGTEEGDVTLSGDGSNAMFNSASANYLKSASLTFKDIIIDAADQQFLSFSSNNWMGDFTLNNVKLCNVRGSGSSKAGCYMTISTAAYTGGIVNITGVTTEGCTGYLFCFGDKVVSVNGGSELSSASYMNGSSTVAGQVIRLASAKTRVCRSTLEVEEGCTLSLEDEYGAGGVAVYANNYSDVTLDACTINGVESSYDIYTTGASDVYNSFTVNGTKFYHKDGTAEIRANNGYVDLTIYDFTGDLTVRLGGSSPTYITLAADLKNDLKFYYGSSISDKDPIVAQGTDNHQLDQDDLDHLIYTGTASHRSLEMSREDGEDNVCRLYRTNFSECTVSLLGSDDPDSNEYVYSATVEDGKIEPEVQVTLKDGTVVSSNQYSVAYYDADKVKDGDGLAVSATDGAGSTKKATAVITPENDMTGDSVTISYTIKVAAYTDLGGEDAPVSVQITFDEDGNSQFEVYYKGNLLTEDKDYVIKLVIDSEEYTLTFTIEGRGEYGGVYERTVELPGRDSKIRIVYNEDTLNDALEDKVEQIYFSSDIIDLTAPVVVNYDVTINGEEFTLYAGELKSSNSEYQQSILDVESGNVTLKNVKIDGQYQARLIYVGSGGNLELTDDTVATDTGYIEGKDQGVNYAAAYIANGGTLTLGNCEVSEAFRHYENSGYEVYRYSPIENYGTLNVQEGAVLKHLFSDTSAIDNAGTLNWTGGTFVVDSANSMSYSTNAAATYDYESAVIYNSGTMKFSGGEINGYLLDGNGEERTDVLEGAISNNGELNMSGGIIQGFNTTGCDVTSVGNSGRPSGYNVGGAVFNLGTFNMTGGEIKNNVSVSGGGVFNVGTFNMSGGIISNNEAYQGGGVYNSSSITGSDNSDINFYMSGGTISGNTLTGDSIKSEEADPDIDDPLGFGGEGLSIYVSPAGSSVYVSGGINAEISGGTITDDSIVTVETTDEDGNIEEHSVSFGIAVSPVNIKSYSFQHNGRLVSHMDAGKLTITGSPDIETGIVLINFCPVTKNVPANKAWLELDGALGTPLNITTLDEFLSSSSDEGEFVNGPNISSIFYRINQDGDIVAGYKDRLAPDESDGQWLQTGTTTYQMHEYFTTSETAEMEGGNYPDVTDERTYDFDAWAICNHTAPLEEVPAEGPTCMDTGNYEYWYCPTCYTLFDEDGQE
ncbi:MAG: hypothetical protein LUD72_06805, partial [Bacteroidales bacterium]|nr:hypothetical protein [Bacteroidales bacterium]